MLSSSPIALSFEFFPPKNDEGRKALLAAAHELAVLDPAFVTVTFGAGGSTKSGTFEAAKLLQQDCGLNVGAHLSYFGTPKAELFAYADQLWDAGIRHLVALRGDIPQGQSPANFKEPDYFEYTSEFVEALLKRHPFDISVGAYPEKHPDAPSLDADLIALEKKCSAGAARAITQFFFDPAIYQNFVSQARNKGILTPITPGLLPIRDFNKICGFAEKCQAHIPQEFKEIFTNSSDPVATGIDLLSRQILALKEMGVSHFHFYTLNHSDMVIGACRQARIRL
ncbi:MAG: hypothetical protein AUJ12_10220 [Alphaproteobacteria bacterium CG1_02_46_17]|nr:MAG: hypothetical protein AUJ12_10220 [Alphaproteobacteria bacterium CG1_02_46_17]